MSRPASDDCFATGGSSYHTESVHHHQASAVALRLARALCDGVKVESGSSVDDLDKYAVGVRADPELDRLIVSRGRMEDRVGDDVLGQPGYFEQIEERRRGRDDCQRCCVLGGHLLDEDDRPQPGGVDEADLTQIDSHRPSPGGHDAVELSDNDVCCVAVKLAGELEGGLCLPVFSIDLEVGHDSQVAGLLGRATSTHWSAGGCRPGVRRMLGRTWAQRDRGRVIGLRLLLELIQRVFERDK